MDKLNETLSHYFGHSSLKEGQKEVITRVLEDTNTLAILPTGGGKSLCYQLSALMKDGLCIVISPLIALMRDQVDALTSKGIAAARLDSSTTPEEYGRSLGRMKDRSLKLLYISPEKLADPAMLKLLSDQSISIVAIDEAHCISDWGHSFRPSYIRLPKIIKKLKADVILALTATASTETANGIRKAFNILKRDVVQTSFYRKNLTFEITPCLTQDKKEQVLATLQKQGSSPAIVYATKRGDVEDVASFLNRSGITARAYHAGMPPIARSEVQDGFQAHRFSVICATIAFGMGVDMPDIRTVIHYHPPKSPEGWIQESGRAGRDGSPSHCQVLINEDDSAILKSMIAAKQPSIHAIEAILQNIFSQGKRAIISNYNLSTLNDIPTELLAILFARLESDGWLAPTGASWMWCHVVPLRWDSAAQERILHGFSKKDQTVLADLIQSKKRVSLLELANHNTTKLNQLTTLLRELEAAGDVRLKLSHRLTHYSIKKQPEKIHHLANEVKEVFEKHAENDYSRIDTVFQIASSKQCIPKSLIKYFGEKLATKCGHCSKCTHPTNKTKIPATTLRDITLDEIEIIQSIIKEKHPALSSPQRLTRFLCGIHSPALLRNRLYTHQHWGMLERSTFDEILAITSTNM